MVKLRTSSSVVNFQERAEKALGLQRYIGKESNYNEPVVFLGLYHNGDWKSFIHKRIKRYVLWCGGDIQNLKRGYLFGDGAGLKKSKMAGILPWQYFIRFIKAAHYCENELQQKDLAKFGIKAKIVPAFWGNIDNFPISFNRGDKFKVYLSGHPGREEEYGWNIVERLAKINPKTEFHLYGSDKEYKPENMIIHGIVSEEQFNQEIKNYHCCLRLNSHDGFSDVLSKSILLCHYPISKIKYPCVYSYNDEIELNRRLNWCRKQKKPYTKAREYYLTHFNNYDFAAN